MKREAGSLQKIGSSTTFRWCCRGLWAAVVLAGSACTGLGPGVTSDQPTQMTLVVAPDIVADHPDAVNVSVKTVDSEGSEVHLVGWETGVCSGASDTEVLCDNGVRYVVRQTSAAVIVERIAGAETPRKIMLRREHPDS
ncbi:MAG: hypothetical protein ACI9MC_002288 [Kiritimatiellia bacterium]|jgi:hypothetical protein